MLIKIDGGSSHLIKHELRNMNSSTNYIFRGLSDFSFLHLCSHYIMLCFTLRQTSFTYASVHLYVSDLLWLHMEQAFWPEYKVKQAKTSRDSGQVSSYLFIYNLDVLSKAHIHLP